MQKALATFFLPKVSALLPTLLEFDAPVAWPGAMATHILGLPDDEIDRLLSEAESRLSAGVSRSTGVVAPIVPSAKSLKATASQPPAAAGDPTAVSKEKVEKLSVRVPQPANKKKVGIVPKSHLPRSLMKTYPI